ncbi:hypothetical protein JCM11491_002203 [Sporobolomyces phaffii]
MSNQPSVTLYVSNLNTKVPKEEVRRSLYCLFNVYGKVLDVVHVRRDKLRGTAFVVFRDLASSTSALRALDGEGFYGKSLRIGYAKSTSHATVELHEGPEAVYAIKLGLRELHGTPKAAAKLTVSGAQKKLIDEKRKEKRTRDDDDDEEEEEEEDDDEERPDKKKKQSAEDDDDDAMDEESDDDDAAAPGPVPAAGGDQQNRPSQTLAVAGLPQEVTTDMLSALFQQYSGLSSVRLLPATGANQGKGTATVVYETVAQAGVAREALDGFLVDKDAPIAVRFADQ